MRAYLYIACCGHSGSTLLEKLLAAAEGVLAMGEICHFSHYFDHPSKPCGCGATVRECSFWRAIVARLGMAREPALDALLPTDGFRAPRLLSNLAHYASLFLPGPAGQLAAAQSGDVGTRTRAAVGNHWRVIDAVVAEAGPGVLVDKSMSVSRLLEIAEGLPDGYRLCVIHLVRDGRATVHSHRKLFGRSTLDATRIWRRANLHAELALTRLRAVPQLRVRYEDLCTDPEGSLQRIAEQFGLPLRFDPGALSARTHAIGGNQAKLTGYQSIALDRRWETELAARERAQFSRSAGWLNWWYGYGLG
jgi:hypothetical protein